MAKIVQLREDITPEGATEKEYRNGYPRTIPQAVKDPVTGESLPQILARKADLIEGKVPSTQLPSYVDDVVEVTTFASLPNPGEQGKIYITTDIDAQYRWTGTAYRNISNPVDFATQEEAEGNSENTKAMTSLRVFQSFVKNCANYVFLALNTASKTLVGAINELHSGLATKASHGYVSDPKTLNDVEGQLSTRIDRHQESLNDLLGIPDVFGYRFQVGQADDRVEAVNDAAYDYATGYAPAGSKRAKLLDKMRPYQCDLDGSNREYLQDDVRKTAGWKDSQLANPEKLQLVRIPHLFYRSFVLDGWNYVLFSELPPEKMEVFSDATQWKEILPCGYARYRGVRQSIEGVQKLLSFSGANPTASVSLINFQASAKNVNTKATVTPYYIYEAVAMLMVLDLGRRNAQLFYAGITNAGTSYANAAATGVTDTLAAPSGEVDVEWKTGSFAKQFRWRFIECFYGQIWNFLTGIYYVYDSANDVNKVFITRDPDKINTNSNYVDYVEVGNTPSVNGWIKEFIPGTIVAGELGGSSTTYASDYNYTSASGATRCALAGGDSAGGGHAGPFSLASSYAPSSAAAHIGASLVLYD